MMMMMNQRASKGMSGANKFFLTIIGLLAIALVAIYLWKEIAVQGVRAEMEDRQEQLAERTRGALYSHTRDMLLLAAVPLSWSVRTEMIKENYNQIDEYLQRFVKEPNVTRVLLVNHEGTIQIATDKKLEGQLAAATLPPGVLQVDRATVIEPGGGGSEILAAVPILSYDARLGTLVVAYSTASIRDMLPAPDAAAGGGAPERPAD